MAFAFLFPGQGSQSLKMMDGWADLPIVRHTFDEASAVLSEDLWAMLQAESVDVVNATANTQPLMLTAGVATWRAWLELGGASPAWVAGHSLGEYTALVAAGTLDFAAAVSLVRLRAQAMQAAVPVGTGMMAAILGLDDDEAICAACDEAAQGAIVAPANFNSPGQVVIAGDCAAVERAMQLCKARGAKRVLPLPVSVPSHCALMKPITERFAAALTSVEFHPPKIKLLHNVDVKCYTQSSEIADALVRQLYQPVRWTQTIQTLVANGIVLMAECGPGQVLTGLTKRIDAKAACFPLMDRAAIEVALLTLV